MTEHPLDEPLRRAGARFADDRGIEMAVDFNDEAAEYAAAVGGAALYDARDRGLIQVTGADRAAWLHNLTTNGVKELPPGRGTYTFATGAKGRIRFDASVLVFADAIWLDLDRRFVAAALAHLDHYLITEDVQLADRTDDFARVALLGPRAAEIVDAIGAPQARSLAPLASATVTLQGSPRVLVRHDFAGVLGMELYIERGDARACWDRLLDIGRPVSLRPVGSAAIDVLRIEAGIPRFGQDFDDTTLPAETGQLERAVSFDKGCYLGQEVVERMRSRGSVARQLVGLRFGADPPPDAGTRLLHDDNEVGRVTSPCHSRALDAPIGIGSLKTACANPSSTFSVASEPPTTAEVLSLPCRSAALPET